jgi:hypothetical protein
MPSLPCGPSTACLLAVSETLRRRFTSRLVDDLGEWWHTPAVVLGLAAVAAAALWVLRRDTAAVPPGPRLLIAALRGGALAALVAVLLDIQRIDEREVIVPSRVAVLVDASGSMALADGPAAAPDGTAIPRSRRGVDVLDAGGLLAALQARHEVALWRFATDARPLALLPMGQGGGDGDWRADLAPVGVETRLGEALAQIPREEPADALAGIVLLTDGASTGGIDPRSAARSLARAGVAVHPVGIGADTAPANVRIADVVAPARVFPGDRFTITAYVQAHGLAGRTARVDLGEPVPAAGTAATAGDVREVELPADGELVAVRFDLPGLETAGRRTLVVRIDPPADDRDPADDSRAVEIEVVDRVTRVLLLAGGPSREYQFMRAVLDRDRSFAADVVLGTATPPAGGPAGAGAAGFPATDEAWAEYDAVVAFDWDWRTLDDVAQGRLERWVAGESGGLVLVAGGVFMEAWLADRRPGPVRGLFPVELGPTGLGEFGAAAADAPRPVRLSPEGQEAEFLWLAAGAATSLATWEEFPGFYACFAARAPKPGATVYARLDADASAVVESPIAMAAQFYGSGTVFYLGSGELWRLRAVGAGLHERLVAQIVRHVAQGRLLRDSRHGRLLVDRDRVAVGGPVAVRLVLPHGSRGATTGPTATATGPDGATVPVPLAAEPGRPDVLGGRFVATREGAWEIRARLPGADETLVRRLQAQLPELETARPQLDRDLLTELAAVTGGTPRFLADAAWTPDRTRELADSIPDRTRREYLTAGPDPRFKERLSAILLGCACGMLCLEWAVRRLFTLA